MSALALTTQQQQPQQRLPSASTMAYAVKLAIEEDKPIMLDYWETSIDKTSIIGVTADNIKLLVKNDEEYTSSIVRLVKSENEIVAMTENSIYIVAHDIQAKRIANRMD